MSVLGYLNEKASSAVLSLEEKESITKSINAIERRLDYFFTTDVVKEITFGSYLRSTILPRYMDENSDIDYMIIFRDSSFKPRTYIDRLKRFAETYYSSSQIYQSSPTIVLELNHIKFDLVPALERTNSKLTIPNRDDWIETDPVSFSSELERKNKNHNYLLKPTIRLFKYWNAQAGYPFNSFLSEKWISELSFSYCTNQRDYFFFVIDSMSKQYNTQKTTTEVNRVKELIKEVREYEKLRMPEHAELRLKKLFRE